MTRLKAGLVLGVLILGNVLVAQEYGDAPAGYAGLEGWSGYYAGLPRLGATCSNDPAPHTVAWTGDNDDGLVGTPFLDSWSDQNTITVSLEDSCGYLVCWVDSNDNGMYEDIPTERYIYSQACLMPGQYTFTGITIKATQNFATAGANKCAVRICCQENVGGPVYANTNGYFWFGEIEDWLVDVEPAKPAVSDTTLPDGREGSPYSRTITPANFTGAVTWTMTSGALPSGLTLVQSGNNFLLSGTPGPGTGLGLQTYTFSVQATSATQSASRTLTLQVWPLPYTAPFADDFSAAQGWELKSSWSRVQAQAYTGYGMSHFATLGHEPGNDFSPSTDNYILSDTPAGTIPQLLPKPIWATSPFIDCSALSSVELRFHRWFSIGSWTHMKIQASADGVNWTTVWQPVQVPGWTPVSMYHVVDLSWTLIQIDISAIAAGQPLVQVRFGLGWVNSAYEYYWGGAGMCGMCLDDFWVGQGMDASASAQNFNISSPNQFTPPPGSATYPICYEGANHPFSVDISNTDNEDIVITGYEAGVTFPAPYGSSLGYVLAHQANCGWIPCGSWVASMPLSISAGQSATLNGDFQHTLMPYGAMQVMDAKIVLFGHTAQSNRPVTLEAVAHFCPYPDPMPGLEVWEAPPQSTGTAQVSNGEVAANLRDFGSAIVGSTSTEIYIICKSTTSNAFTVDPPTLYGPDWTDFSLQLPSPWQSAPQQGQNNCYFVIRFTPQSPGQKSCWIEFTHTAPNTGTPFRFEVKGLGLMNGPVLGVHAGSVTGQTISNGMAAVGPLDFGQQLAGSGPGNPLEIWIENAGTQDLTLGAPAFSAASVEFTLDITGMAGVLNPGSSTSFLVYYDPSQTGLHGATIEFAHNDIGTNTPFSFSVAGEGVLNAPRIEVYEDVPPTPLQPGAAAIGRRDFGQQPVAGGPTQGVLIEIRNTGWQPLSVNTPALTGTHAGDFTLDLATFSSPVAPGASTFFEVAFDPTSKGFKYATVSFTHDDPAVASPFTFDVEGLGDDPFGVFIMSSVLTTAQANVSYSTQLYAGAGTQPYTWTLIGSVLPAGLMLNTDGSITGTPTQAGLFTFRVRVTDANGGTDERVVSLLVSPAPGTISGGGMGGGGGCAADSNGGLLAMLLLGLAVFAVQRRRARQ